MKEERVMKHLCRHVEVISSDGKKAVYGLSIVVLKIDESDNVIGVNVRPFEREEPFVEYVFSNMELRQLADGSWQKSGTT